MIHPSRVLLKAWGIEVGSEFQLGRLAMALEMITSIRSIEDIPVLDEPAKAAVVSAFETLLVEQQIADMAYEMYDHLSRWRRIKTLERVANGPLVAVQRGIDEIDVEVAVPDDGSSSPHVSPAGADSRIAKTRALTGLHRSQDALPIDEPGERLYEVEQELSSAESTSLWRPTEGEDTPEQTQLPVDSDHPET
jgi:hypothetical protein